MVYLVEIYSSRRNMLSRWGMSSAGNEAGQRRESLDLFSFTRHGTALVRTRCCPPGRACVQAAGVRHCNLHAVQRQRAGAPSRSASRLSRRWRGARRQEVWHPCCPGDGDVPDGEMDGDLCAPRQSSGGSDGGSRSSLSLSARTGRTMSKMIKSRGFGRAEEMGSGAYD
jgi:hypothetical protein